MKQGWEAAGRRWVRLVVGGMWAQRGRGLWARVCAAFYDVRGV